jgi:hypothetical protein
MAKMTCLYKFPCHPEEMFRKSIKTMDDSKKMLRIEGIKMIANLSQDFTQKDMDGKVYVDVLDGDIVGFDVSGLMGIPSMRALCVGNRRVQLGKMTAHNWCTMRV